MFRRTSFALILGLSLPTLALAHPGHETHSFLAGALHPLGGLDHLLAMLAVGLLAGRSEGRLRWGLPASFMTAMMVGAMLGAGGVAAPLVEVGIALSLVSFGAALAWKQTFRAPLLLALTAMFAMFHGHAHGAEMGADLSAAMYGAGFILATGLLHACGVLLATRMSRPASQPLLLRWSGSAIAGVGLASLGLLVVAQV